MIDGSDRARMVAAARTARAESNTLLAAVADVKVERSSDWPPVVRERPQPSVSTRDLDAAVGAATIALEKSFSAKLRERDTTWRDALHRSDATRRKDDDQRREQDRLRIEATKTFAQALDTTISEMREQIVQLRAEVTFLRAGLTELREKLPSP
jgi:hypothetical protein